MRLNRTWQSQRPEPVNFTTSLSGRRRRAPGRHGTVISSPWEGWDHAMLPQCGDARNSVAPDRDGTGRTPPRPRPSLPQPVSSPAVPAGREPRTYSLHMVAAPLPDMPACRAARTPPPSSRSCSSSTQIWSSSIHICAVWIRVWSCSRRILSWNSALINSASQTARGASRFNTPFPWSNTSAMTQTSIGVFPVKAFDKAPPWAVDWGYSLVPGLIHRTFEGLPFGAAGLRL